MIESEVIELVRTGRREQALAMVLQGFRRKVFGLALSYMRNRAAAEDVAQEVFIKVWKALPRFDGRASLSTWIYTITRNTCFSALRGQPEMHSMSEPETLAEIGLRAGEETGAVAAEAASLVRLMDRLPAKQRQVVMLFYMEDRSYEEVASMLAMPVGTVKALLHRARSRLSAAAGAAAEDTQ